MRILVTGAGAGPAISIIKALKAWDRDPERIVVATDMNGDAAGFMLADQCVITPATMAADFVPALLKACSDHHIEMVIPILDADAAALSAAADMFCAAGTAVATHTPQSIRQCSDKLLAYQLCLTSGIRQPESFSGPGDAPDEAFPILAKPRRGVSARGIMVFPNRPAAMPFADTPGDLLWQRFVQGQEFSIDTFSRPSLGDFVAVPRRRDIVKAGQMVRGETCADPQLVAFAAECCEAFGLTDVACIQVIREVRSNELFFIEANPRYGTGVSLSIAAGVFFPRLQHLRNVLRKQIPATFLKFQPGVRMARFWEEIYELPDSRTKVVGLGRLRPPE
jgi:carbamoyl-phosphate synthase large subunit